MFAKLTDYGLRLEREEARRKRRRFFRKLFGIPETKSGKNPYSTGLAGSLSLSEEPEPPSAFEIAASEAEKILGSLPPPPTPPPPYGKPFSR